MKEVEQPFSLQLRRMGQITVDLVEHGHMFDSRPKLVWATIVKGPVKLLWEWINFLVERGSRQLELWG